MNAVSSLGLLLLYVDGLTTHQQWSISCCEWNNASTAVSGYSCNKIIWTHINYRSSAVNQGSVNYFVQFLYSTRKFSTSLSICSEVSWYHCLQPPLHHTILSEAAFEPVKRQLWQYTCINHSVLLGRLKGLLERWIGKWLLSLKTLDQVVYHLCLEWL